MSEAVQYRAQARSFERQAAEARRPGAREEFLKLAQLWNQLADESERVERQGRSRAFGERRNTIG
jgi:hypothetical protein